MFFNIDGYVFFTSCYELRRLVAICTAFRCWYLPCAVRLRSSNTGPIWIVSRCDACLLVQALLRSIKRATSSRQRLDALNTKRRECGVIRMIAVLLLPSNFMSCCIHRADHSIKVKVSGKSWSFAATTCASASRSKARARI